jgi:hypothetical protein
MWEEKLTASRKISYGRMLRIIEGNYKRQDTSNPMMT